MSFLSSSDLKDLPAVAYRSLLSLARGEPLSHPMALHVDAEMKVAAKKIPGQQNFSEDQRGMFLPLEMLARGLTSNTYGSGGAFVGDQVGEIDPMLRAASVFAKAGSKIITGLTRNLALPREITGTSFAWLHELEAISESDGTFGALNLAPHRLGGATSISTQLDAQTGGVLADFLVASLVRGIGVGIDRGALVGSGVAGEPLGLWNAPNVNSVTFSAAATLAKAVSFEKQITAANGEDSLISFVATSSVREKWKQIQRWTGASVALWSDDDFVVGKRAYVTENAQANGIAAGDFSKMIIAFWGEQTPIQIIVNPFSQDTAGRIRFVVHAYADTGILRPETFTRNADSAIQ